MTSSKYPNPVDMAVCKAMCETLLSHIIEPMRLVARDAGYSITVHGSLARDIDLVLIPWTDKASGNVDLLITRLAATVASITGRCNPYSDWTDKPHGRKAKTLLVWGDRFGTIDLDVSVMPIICTITETD